MKKSTKKILEKLTGVKETPVLNKITKKELLKNNKTKEKLTALSMDYAGIPDDKISKILNIRKGSVKKWKAENYFVGYCNGMAYGDIDSVRSHFLHYFVKTNKITFSKRETDKIKEFFKNLSDYASIIDIKKLRTKK